MEDDHARVATAELLNTARQYKTELLAKMFEISTSTVEAEPVESVLPTGSNVVGVGYGAKVTAGSGIYESDGLAVRVYVYAKMPQAALSQSGIVPVPPSVNGTPTDVVQVGDLTALTRPTMCGVSCGHRAVTAGTLGYLVRQRDLDPDDHYILSNNHVLANVNNAAIGDAILEPGLIDGGNPDNPIATLTDFHPIHLGSSNGMDAAIAKVLNPNDVVPSIVGIGRVPPLMMKARLYQSVRKRGRTTGHTLGTIMDLAADVSVRYGTVRASFEDQIQITGVNGPFSHGGDSGSLVLDAVTRRPVALLFAGGTNGAFANPIEPVLDRFAVDFV